MSAYGAGHNQLTIDRTNVRTIAACPRCLDALDPAEENPR